MKARTFSKSTKTMWPENAIKNKKSPKLTCYNIKLSAYNNNVSKTNSFRLQLKMKFEADYGGNIKEIFIMNKNKIVVPEAKDAMNKFKMEAANEVGVAGTY